MATSIKVNDPVQGLISYVLDVKPYHTKIAEIIVEYIYNDNLNVTMTEVFHSWMHQEQPHSYFRAKVKGIGLTSIPFTYSLIGIGPKVLYISGNFADRLNPNVLRPGYVLNVSAQGQLTQQYTVSNVQYDTIQQRTIVLVKEPVTFGATSGTIKLDQNLFVMTKAVYDTLQTAQYVGNANVDYELIECAGCSPCYSSLTQAVRNDAIVYEQYKATDLPCYTILKPKKPKGKQKRTEKTKFVEYYGGNYTRAFSVGRKFRVKQSYASLNDRVYTVKSSFFDIHTQATYVYVEEQIASLRAPFGEADVFMFDQYAKPITYRTGYGDNFNGPNTNSTVYEIVGVDGRSNTITVSGNHLGEFFTGELISARYSPVDGVHTVLNSVLDGNGNTVIYTYDDIRSIPSGPTFPVSSSSGSIFLLTETVGAFTPGFYRYSGTGWQTYHGGELVHTTFTGYSETSLGHFESMPDLYLQVYFTEHLEITSADLDFHDFVYLADMENPYRGFQYGFGVDAFGSYQSDVEATVNVAVIGAQPSPSAYILQGKRDTMFVRNSTLTVLNPTGTQVQQLTVNSSLYNSGSNTTHVFVNGAPLSGDLTGYTVPFTYKNVFSFPQHVGYSSFGEDVFHLSDVIEVDSTHNALKVHGGNFLRRFVPTVNVSMLDRNTVSFSTGHTKYLPFSFKSGNSFAVPGDYSWLFRAGDYVYVDYYPAPVRQTITIEGAVYSVADELTQLIVTGDRTLDLFRAAGRIVVDWASRWMTTTSRGVYSSTGNNTYILIQGDQSGVFSPFIGSSVTIDFTTFPDITDGIVRLLTDGVFDGTSTYVTSSQLMSPMDGYILAAVYRQEGPKTYTYFEFSNTVSPDTAAIYYKIPPSLRIDTEVELLDEVSASLFTNIYDQDAAMYRVSDGSLVAPPTSGNTNVFEFRQGNILQRFVPGYPFYGKNVTSQVSGPYVTSFLPVSNVQDYQMTIVGPVDFSFLFVPGAKIYVDYIGSELNDFEWFTIVSATSSPIPGAWQIVVNTVEQIPHPVGLIPLSVLSGVQLTEQGIVKTRVWVKNTTVAQDLVEVYHENWTSKGIENLLFSDELARSSDNNGLTRTQMATTFIEQVSFRNVVNQWFQFFLLQANATNRTFVVVGNAAADLIAGSMFEVVGTNRVDGKYTSISVSYSPISSTTTITVDDDIPPGWLGPNNKPGWIEPADTRFKWNIVASNTGSADLVVEGDATQDLFTGRDFMIVLANGFSFDNIRVQSTAVYDANTHTTSFLTLPPITIDASGGYVRHTVQEENMGEKYTMVLRDTLRVGCEEDTLADTVGYSGYPEFDFVNGFATGIFDISPFDQNIQQSLHLYNSTFRF